MAGCSLDKSAKHNWVEDAGGLPEYICEVARAVARGGKDLDSAIPIAIAQIKKWAAGVTGTGQRGVPKAAGQKTQAKAKAALAQWEALKAKAKAKSGAKDAVKACETLADNAELDEKAAGALYLTFAAIEEGELAVEEYERSRAAVGPATARVLALANADKDWSLDAVRTAYSREQTAKRKARRQNSDMSYYDSPDYRSIREVHSNYVLVSAGYDDGGKFYKVPYDVGDDGSITFGAEQEVKQQYVPVNDAQPASLSHPLARTAGEKIISAAATREVGRSYLDKIVAATNTE